MVQSIRVALRVVLKYPGFALAAVLTLGLGIGANVALFSVANTFLLRPPSGVAAPERLVVLGRMSSDGHWRGFGHESYKRYRDAARSFSGLTAFRGATVLWSAGDETVPLRAMLVTGDYFGVLGVRMAKGRGFLHDEDRTPGAAPVVVVSDEAWRERFGSDTTLVGQTVRLNGREFTVVGIAPRGFQGLQPDDGIDVWIPLMMEGAVRPSFPLLNSDFFSVLTVVGRLARGVELAQAQAELNVLAGRFERPEGPARKAVRVVATPHLSLPDPGWRGYVTGFLVPLFGAAALVLLVVCANLAGLLTARSTARRHEMAVRLALGAGRGRLAGQMVGEGMVFVIPGALAGLFVSRLGVALIRAQDAQGLTVRMDGRVLAFTAALSVASVLLFALLPAVQAAPRNPARALKDDRGTGPRRSRLRAGLVTAQVAASLVLVTGTGLLARTIRKAMAADVGFETRHLLSFGLDLTLAGYTDEQMLEFYPRVATALSAMPGVRSVSWASDEPTGNDSWPVIVDAGASPGEMPRIDVRFNEIGPRYFTTAGIPVVRGRGIAAGDDNKAPLVAVISESMARRQWPKGDPIGKRLRLVLFMHYSPPLEIVGVVPDVGTVSLDTAVRPEVFVAHAQYAGRREGIARFVHVLVRVGPGFSGRSAIQDAIHRLDPGLPRVSVESVADEMSHRLEDQRLYAELLGSFGALALLLAAIGLYGLLAFDIACRSREIGVRMALGATRRNILRTVMRQGLLLVAMGIGLGLVGAALLTKTLASLLYGVSSYDTVTFMAASIIILGVALLAIWLPARHATEVEPVRALHAE